MTGIDILGRSLDYEEANAIDSQLLIDYHNMDYRNMSYEEAYDVITMIYCDFSVFSEEDRNSLLQRIYKALKPNGKFIMDVFSRASYEKDRECQEWTHYETGFWSSSPHLCLSAHYLYDECHTRMDQYVVITDTSVECNNIWDHTFSTEELEDDLEGAGFQTVKFYGNVAGEDYHPDSEVICAVAVN